MGAGEVCVGSSGRVAKGVLNVRGRAPRGWEQQCGAGGGKVMCVVGGNCSGGVCR